MEQRYHCKKLKDEVVNTGKNIKETMERGKLCLVGKVIADKKRGREAFKNTMLKVWKFCVGTKIIEVGDKLYIFKFQSEAELSTSYLASVLFVG